MFSDNETGKRWNTNGANLTLTKQEYWCVGGNKEIPKDSDVMYRSANSNGKLEAETMLRCNIVRSI